MRNPDSYAVRVRLWAALILILFGVALASWKAEASPEGRIFRDGFGGDGEAGGAEPPSDPCEHPLVEPAGWTPQQKSWVDAWSSPHPRGPRAVFPNGIGSPVPIGANIPNQYLLVPFVMDANLTITVTWDIAQPQQGYLVRPATSMFIGFSPCRGDFRMRTDLEPCAKVAGGGSLFLSSKTTGSNVCPLEAGKQYWMTVAPVDPRDGLDFGEHTCSLTAPNSASGCDVQARHTAN